jgi:hypothetical protein
MKATTMALLAGSALAGCVCAQAQQVKVWALPKGGTAENRAGWKEAGAGEKFQHGAALDTGRAVLTVVPGAAGAALRAAGADFAAGTEIGVVPQAGEAGRVDSVRLVKRDDAEATLEVGFGAAAAAFRMAAGQPLVEVAPGKGAAAVEVRGKIAYSVLPDFFGFDSVFDPKGCESDRLTPPAENFLLGLGDGGNSIAVCAWQGTLSLGKEPAADAKEPRVDLFFGGKGAERVVERARIEFLGKPVFVSLLAGRGIWHERDMSREPAQKPVELDWKRPFDAKWRADFIGRKGAFSQDHLSGSLTADALRRGEGGRWDADGLPRISMQGLWPYFVYAFWVESNRTCVAAYADMVARKAVEKKNSEAQAAAKKAGTAFTPEYPSNMYERVIIYPLDRRASTPLAEWTFTDAMRESLGQGPCAYVLDLEGIKPRNSGGVRETLATCGNWDNYVFKFTGVFAGGRVVFKAGGKDVVVPGLKPGEKLQPDGEALLVEKLEDMTLFVTTVNARLQEYRKFSDQIAALCGEEGAKSQAVKPVADRVLRPAAQLQQRCSEKTLAGMTASRDQWDAKVKAIVAEVKTGVYTNVAKVGAIRGYAESQDVLVAFCRRSVKSIRNEASIADLSDPEALKFAARVRTMCHAVLRNKHGMEGW